MEETQDIISPEMEKSVESNKTFTSRVNYEISKTPKLKYTLLTGTLIEFLSKILFVLSTISFVLVHMRDFNIFYTLAGFSLALFIYTFAKVLKIYVFSKATTVVKKEKD